MISENINLQNWHLKMVIVVTDCGGNMTKQELLKRLERIRDGVLDSDTQFMLEGMCDDITDLMNDVSEEGVE